MLRFGLQHGARRLLTTSATRSKQVDLVCPICFDFGFSQTAFRGSVEDDASETAKSRPSSPKSEHSDNGNAKAIPGSPPKPTTPEAPQNSSMRSKIRSSMNLLTNSETMKHKYENKIEAIYTMPIDNDIVDARVYDLLEGQEPNFQEGGHEEAQSFVKAELIKNKSIPFKYWLEQPCPSHRNTGDQVAPCVTLRRGLHDYMMETSPGYAQRQELMRELGFVTTGGSSASQCLRIGHLGAGELPAHAWGVESFLKTGMKLEMTNASKADSLPIYRGLTVFERTVPSGNTASDEAFQKATNWFRECNDTHEDCLAGEILEMPDRVLDIAAEDTASGVKLIQTNGKKARYACLSHRWGKETSQATKQNVESLYNEVPWDYLSPTYQDSITFLRKFSKWHQDQYGEEIRYIWIDSLCIIQDSKSDWKKHSLKMSDIYSNSSITLVESHGLHTEKRLFQDSTARRGSKSSVSIQDAEVWKRAWVFQERLLSRRLLIFGPDELSWQCASHHKCECGLEELETQSDKLMKEWEDDIHIPLHSATWRLVVEEYSRLDYTYRSDTLFAIAGLAKNFNARLGGKKYFAGIWYNEYDELQGSEEAADWEPQAETALDLLWRLAYFKDAEREDLPEPAVPISWSWAYPECEIVYPFHDDEVINQYTLVASIGGAMNVPKLPDDHDQPRNWVMDDMYTEVPPSAIILAGPLWKTEVTAAPHLFTIQDTEYPEYTYFLGAMSAEILQESAVGRQIRQTRLIVTPPKDEGESNESAVNKMPQLVFYPDSTKTVITESFYCLPMASFKRLPIKATVKEKVVFAALVLEPVGHKANTEGYDPDLSHRDPSELVFRRVGLAYTTDGGWREEHDKMLEKMPANIVYIVQ
ncbi:heterokaryon incompatibility protein (HET) domain-containing protein [Trichoderma breve]|uniref:Heterokaryon incompatibility protein (HET) domain-containing protein n=1 Tax=Trichoderma breve TaxID=2034170 RepID=A0A9W9E3P0_9HYPO|nr:heterokaryon incompatibility protein (HET) domain-containing protein [Trichoderma breve]KAJ4857823.1 heterokaryon incompatibility protein (HET) domain-containing protein [Trichoderma breve]